MLTIEMSSRGNHGRCGRRRAVESWVGGEEGMSILGCILGQTRLGEACILEFDYGL